MSRALTELALRKEYQTFLGLISSDDPQSTRPYESREGRKGGRERGSEDPLESMTDGSLADKSALVKRAESSGDWPRLPDGKI